VAENLHRCELTVLERSEHVAEWVRITEGKAGEKLAGATCATQHDARGQRKSPQQMPSGINAAVRELGVERTQAQRAVKISAITPKAKAAAVEAGIDDNQA
jgi:ParB family chromosome partitioning protein